jgi:hypothetical protein
MQKKDRQSFADVIQGNRRVGDLNVGRQRISSASRGWIRT